MSDESALLAAIRANPTDDLPRLVYADWLEENGRHERAQYIRDAIAADRGQLRCERDGLPNMVEGARAGTTRPDGVVCADFWRPRCRCRGCKSARNVYVQGDHTPWIDGFGFGVFHPALRLMSKPSRGFVGVVYTDLLTWVGGRCPTCRGGYYFGNVADNRGCLTCFNSHSVTGIGPAVVTSHPIGLVIATDVNPAKGTDGRWRWGIGIGPNHLPQDVFLLIPRGPWERDWFATHKEAIDTASAALIAWAKVQTAEFGRSSSFRPQPTTSGG